MEDGAQVSRIRHRPRARQGSHERTRSWDGIWEMAGELAAVQSPALRRAKAKYFRWDDDGVGRSEAVEV